MQSSTAEFMYTINQSSGNYNIPKINWVMVTYFSDQTCKKKLDVNVSNIQIDSIKPFLQFSICNDCQTVTLDKLNYGAPRGLQSSKKG